jgi:serine/threonine protein kinase/WD40 repeat protein
VPGYEIQGELGRGGMGVVYQARQVALDRVVALKVVLAGSHADAEELARFRREAEAIARLHHANVVEIYEVGEVGGLPHFAMEFCAGGNLAQKLAVGPLPPRRAAALVQALASAVQAAHEAGVVHRDLKPGNVLLAADGIPKITDFGLAKKLEGTSQLTATGAIVGTPSYMAPEQAAGEGKRVGPAADVYSLGAILYECLTGRPPFQAATTVDTLLQVVADPPVPPSQLQPGIPAHLEAICLRCLEKKPGRRFATAAELAGELQRFLDGLPAQVQPRTGPTQEGWKRPSLVFCLWLVVLVLTVAGFAVKMATLPRSVRFGDRGSVLALGGSRPWLAMGSGYKSYFEVYDFRTGNREVWGGNDCSALAFAPGKDLLAVGRSNGGVLVYDLSLPTEAPDRARPYPPPRRGEPVPAHDRKIQAVAFSRDGRTLITAAGPDPANADAAPHGAPPAVAEVRRWDLATGQMLSSVQAKGWLSHDGQVGVGRSPNGTLELWDPATGLTKADLGDPGGAAELVRLSPDGRLLAAAAGDGTVWLWDLADPAQHKTLQPERVGGAGVRSLVFSPAGGALAAAGTEVTVWDTHTCQSQAHLPVGSLVPVALTLDANGLYLRGTGRVSFWDSTPTETLTLVDLANGRVLHQANQQAFLALSPDSTRVVTLSDPTSSRSTVEAWERDNFGKQPMRAADLPLILGMGLSLGGFFFFISGVVSSRPVERLVFSPDGDTLASVGPGGTLRLWDMNRECLRLTVAGPWKPATDLQTQPIRSTLEILWASSKPVLRALAFTADGNTLVTLDDNGGGQLWDVADGRQQASFQLPLPPRPTTVFGRPSAERPVGAAAFGPDGRLLATLARDTSTHPGAAATLTLWDLDLGPALSTPRRASVPIQQFSVNLNRPPAIMLPVFTRDGSRLAIWTTGGVKLWDVAPAGLRERPLEGVAGDGDALSPDGRLVAVISGGRTIKVWDLATDRLCCALAHKGGSKKMSMAALLFSPDGRLLAGARGDVRLWDPLTGRELGQVETGSRNPTALAFSPDGRTLAVGDHKGQVSWHDVEAIRRGARQRSDRLQQQVGAVLSAFGLQELRAVIAPSEAPSGPAHRPALPSEPVSVAMPPERHEAGGSSWDIGTVPPAPAGEVTGSTVPPEEGVQVPPPPTGGVPEVPGYELLAELGRGGMGVVYQARQVGLNRLVALKVVLAGAHASADEMARFHREAEAIARLHHPNVIRVYEAGEHNGLPFFAMELCPGDSLARRLGGRPLPPREAASLTAAVARGVQAAHAAGVVHRDLKPANILLAVSDQQSAISPNQHVSSAGLTAERCLLNATPKVTDFGLAKTLEGSTALTVSGAILGTPSYMAPEQAEGKGKDVGPAADVYSLGAILYECLTGRPPFQEATPLDTIVRVVADPPVPPSRLRPRIPPALEAICLKCLEKEPRRRYPSAAALAEDLDAFLAGHQQQRRPRKSRDIDRLLSRLHRQGVLLPTALVLLAVALPCLVASYAISERTPRTEFPSGTLACLSPDGSQLLVVDGGEAVLHDTHTGEGLASYQAPAQLTAAAFSAEGNLLALGEGNGNIELWDLKTGQIQPPFKAHEGPIGTLVFGRDGAVFAGRGKPEEKADTVEAVRRWEPGRPGPVLAVPGLLSPDGRSLVEKADDSLNLWDTTTAQLRASLPVRPEVNLGLAFSPDGATLVTVLPSVAVRQWDTATGQERAPLHNPPAFNGYPLFSPDSRRLLIGYNKCLWDLETGQELAYPRGLDSYHLVAFSPNGQGVIARSGNRYSSDLCLLDPLTGTELGRVGYGRKPSSAKKEALFGLVAVAVDERTLVTAEYPTGGGDSTQGRLRVWNWEPYWRGQPILGRLRWLGWLALVPAVLLGLLVFLVQLRLPRRVLALAFRADGRALATGSADGSLRLWDLDAEQVRVLAGTKRPLTMNPTTGVPSQPGRSAVFALAFRRGEGGEELAVMDHAGVLEFWDLEAGREPESHLCPPGRLTAAAFSTDGRWLAYVAGDRPLRPWQSFLHGFGLSWLARRPQQVWLWDLSCRRPREAAAGPSQREDSAEGAIGARVLRVLASLSKVRERIYLLAALPLFGPIIAFWVYLNWQLALPLTGGWLLLAEIVLRFIISPWMARKAVNTFNREFPEGSAERLAAVEIMARLPNPYPSAKKIKKALGVPPEPQAAARPAFTSTAGVSLDTKERSFLGLTFAPSGAVFAARTGAGLTLYRLCGNRLCAGADLTPRPSPLSRPTDGRWSCVGATAR